MPTESSRARTVHKTILEARLKKQRDEGQQISYNFISCLSKGNGYLKHSDEPDTFEELFPP